MKKNILLLIALLLLGAIAYYLFASQKGKSAYPDRDFAVLVDDIGSIKVQKVGDAPQTFKREGKADWKINDLYKVSEFTMPVLLNTIEKIEIQNIPARGAVENIVKDMKDHGIKVEIFDRDGKKIKGYTIGDKSYDKTGTNFLMDGYDQPYNMRIRGFDGDIRTRFINSVTAWRDKEVLQIDAKDIREIEFKYPKNEKNSFRLTQNNGKIDVAPLSQFIQRSTRKVNEAKAKSYLDAYKRIYAEAYDNENMRRDSIADLIPFATVRIKDVNNKISEVDLYPFRDLVYQNTNTRDLEELKLIDRLFVNKKHTADFMIVQSRNIIGIFQAYDYFLE